MLDRIAIRMGRRLMAIGAWLTTGRYWPFIDRVIGRQEETAPYVCPGCFTVGGGPCLPGCIDAEIEAEREYGWDHESEDSDA